MIIFLIIFLIIFFKFYQQYLYIIKRCFSGTLRLLLYHAESTSHETSWKKSKLLVDMYRRRYIQSRNSIWSIHNSLGKFLEANYSFWFGRD